MPHGPKRVPRTASTALNSAVPGERRRRAPRVRYRMVGVAVAACLSIGLLGLATASSMPSASLAPDPEPLSNIELEVALRRAGISPESLAAAGVSPQQVPALVARARADLSEGIVAFRAAQRALSESRAGVDRLTRKVRAGLADQNEIAALQSARASFAAAESAHEDELDQVFMTAAQVSEGGLNSGQLALLGTARQNAAWDLPDAYKVRSASEPDWVDLRDALAAERIAQRDSQEVPSSATDVLNQWRSHPSVAAALTTTDMTLDAVRAAWSAAIGGGG